MGTRRSLRVWLNGRLVPLSRARISVFDRGFLFGDGIYETLRAYDGRPFRTGAHLGRLAESARRLKMRIPVGREELLRGVGRVVSGNRLRDARVRIVVSRGSGEPDLLSIRDSRPAVLIYAVPYSPPPPVAYRDGVRAIIPAVARNDRRSLDPAIKSCNLINNLLAALEARRARAREAIMLNPGGYVAEAASANVFFVSRGRLLTPALASGILAGITRALVINLARRLGFPVREGLFRLGALMRAEEVFVTASTIEILPVASIAAGRRRRVFPRCRPYTRALQEGYRVTVEDELGL